jgi:branched-chain amino acid transport system permease protein
MSRVKLSPLKAFIFTPRRMSERSLAILSAILIIGLLSVPAWGTSAQMRTLIEFMSLLALAQMWNLLAGYAGMVSFGQQAWIGLGGYTLVIFADDLNINMYLAVFIGGLVAALISIPTAGLVFRLRGGYFAVGTWVVAEVFRLLVASQTRWLQGGAGRTLAAAGAIERTLRENYTYWLAVVIGVGSVALVYYVVRSHTGLGLTAIRDAETAAAGVGINITRIKLIVYVLAAFCTGITGGLIYLNILRITPDAAFSVQWAAFMAFIVVIGGLGTIEGPIIGAIIFFVIREYLSDFGEWSLILLGGTAVVMMLIAPKGIWGLIQRYFSFELFPVRRRLPSHLRHETPTVSDHQIGVRESATTEILSD